MRRARRGRALLRSTDAEGRVFYTPYASRRERAVIEQALIDAQVNARWMAEQARLGWPLFADEPTIPLSQSTELQALYDLDPDEPGRIRP